MIRTLNHSIPLDPNGERWAYLTIPVDLTLDEARRIGGTVAALALDENASLPDDVERHSPVTRSDP